jgi:hypothetical protein
MLDCIDLKTAPWEQQEKGQRASSAELGNCLVLSEIKGLGRVLNWDLEVHICTSSNNQINFSDAY